jgi:hypothetical protein
MATPWNSETGEHDYATDFVDENGVEPFMRYRSIDELLNPAEQPKATNWSRISRQTRARTILTRRIAYS